MSSSAEKTEQPTPKRLVEARKKGQVPQSKQVSGIFVVAVGVALCFAFWGRVSASLTDILLYLSGSVGLPWREFLPVFLDKVTDLTGTTILPVMLFLCIAMTVGKFVCSGFSFSFEPMKPELSKFNMLTNVKQVFGIASLYNLVFMIGVSSLSAIIGWKVFLDEKRDLTYSIYCGLPCISIVLSDVFFWILAPVIGVLFLWSFAEIAVQRAVFRKNMKMTKDEVKREHKESFGDPQLMGARKQAGRELATGARLSETTFAITGKDIALGFQYHARTVPIPLLLFKFRGKGVQTLIRVAKQNQIPVFYRSDLAQRMAKGQPVGEVTKRAFFSRLAEVSAHLDLAAKQTETANSER